MRKPIDRSHAQPPVEVRSCDPRAHSAAQGGAANEGASQSERLSCKQGAEREEERNRNADA